MLGSESADGRDTVRHVRSVRACCRPGCNRPAVATLTYVYSDSTAVVGPLATVDEPHSWDLCEVHGSSITAPKGWELMKYEGGFTTTSPDDDDLTALAEAVREAGSRDRSLPRSARPTSVPRDRMASDQPSSVPVPTARTGRRGHLRVLPDPAG